MKSNRPYRNFMLGMGAIIFLTIAAHAHKLGAVQFANGSTTPTRIPEGLLTQAKASSQKPGHVVLLRAGASPVGGRAYNFVLSGERAAAIRNTLVKAGIPRKEIVSQYVGIVHRGSAAADRAVIIDATTRAALGLAPTGHGDQAALQRLEAQVQALETAAHKAAHKPMPKTVKVKSLYSGRVWYATRTMSENSFAPGYSGASTAGDNYQSSGYGFSLHTRRATVFNFWTPYQIPLRFSLAGMSQKWQVANPVLQGTQGMTYLPGGVLFYPANTRDSVSTEYLHGSIQSPLNVFGATVTPGVKIGWLGEQSLSGGETSAWMYSTCTTQGCPTVTTASTSGVGGSAISVTPSLSVAGQDWKIGYSQSPWGGQGFAAPRVLMGTVSGHGVTLSLGEAFPDCGMCSSSMAIQNGQIVKLGARDGGWAASLIYVGGEQFMAGGQVMPGTLAQALAPYNPSRPWNSYNPGTTISLTKRLAKGLDAVVTYSLDHQSGSYSSVTTKTTELSIHGRF